MNLETFLGKASAQPHTCTVPGADPQACEPCNIAAEAGRIAWQQRPQPTAITYCSACGEIRECRNWRCGDCEVTP